MFEAQGKALPNTLWGVWALWFRPGKREDQGKEQVYSKCIFVPRWRPLSCMGTQEQREKENASAAQVGVDKPRLALDLFCGTGSVGRELEALGYHVISLDNDHKRGATFTCDVRDWEYWRYPVGYFDVIFASPPCTEFSQAKTTGIRDLKKADELVRRTLEIVEYFQPTKWFLENPRHGLLRGRPYMEGIPWVDVDYCQVSDWGYKKPTRIWGGDHVVGLKDWLCVPKNCPHTVQGAGGQWSHREKLGGSHIRMSREDKYRVPAEVVRFVLDEKPPLDISEIVQGLGAMQLSALHEVRFESDFSEENLEELALQLVAHEGLEGAQGFVQSVVVASDCMQDGKVKEWVDALVEEFKESVFSAEVVLDKPVRGPFGEATIELKPDAQPVKQRPYQMHGERREALAGMVDDFVRKGYLEPGQSAWNSPAFPVPKKTPGSYRMVVDYRRVNDATLTDAHPLPRIEDILQRQGKHKLWTVLDMKEGYHQVPLKKEHRHITCMSTPRGVMQWRVLVMGLKNGGAIFQRMMEWVLQGLDCVDVYIDDVIIGSSGDTPEEVLENHYGDVHRVLVRLREHGMVVEAKKAHWFAEEVEFCGHLMRNGRREPAPGKLASIQKWELPRTVTQLRGFLGLANYYSSYVPKYAEYAGPLMSKLQLNREDGKKGSTKPLVWKESEKESFEELKKVLASELELFRVDPDLPFVMDTDASDKAIGAVLQQHKEIGGQMVLVPVGFFSRKLAKSQLNWTPREKETYAIVSALRKWAGWIGLQPLLIRTDHKSLEDWVKEKMDTPSGPAGRRARWHETLSKFDLTVQYFPGEENVVADAMSRYAYPACKAFQDASFHGSEQARWEMKKIVEEELAEGRLVGLVTGPGENGRHLLVGGRLCRSVQVPPQRIFVVTRGGTQTDEHGQSGGEVESVPTPQCERQTRVGL